MYDFYIGIDPGTNGAISILNDKLDIVYCDNLPKSKNRRGGNILDLDKFLHIFYLAKGRIICGLEDVWSQPVQGVKSAGSFMFAYGCIRTTLCILKIPYIEILPVDWKREYGIKKKKGQTQNDMKKVSLELVRQMYPKDKTVFRLVGDHNKAESVLLARFVWHKYSRSSDA